MDEQLAVSQGHGFCVEWRERFAVAFGPGRSREIISQCRSLSQWQGDKVKRRAWFVMAFQLARKTKMASICNEE